LAIGHGCRDPVDQHPYPAHPEGRTRAESANGKLQILSIVLAVLDLQAWYAPKGFRKVDARCGMSHILAAHHADCGRGVQFGDGLRRGADDQGLFIRGHRTQRAKNDGNEEQW